MKKTFYIISIFFLCLFLTGCNNNSPEDKVSEYLSRYVSISSEVDSDIELSVASSGLSSNNQKVYRKVLVRQFESMEFKINNEEINGDEAVVSVRINVYDLYKSDKNSLEYLSSHNEEFYVDGVLNRELYETYRVNNMYNMNERVDYDINIYLTKKNGIWIIENPDTETLEKIHGLYNYEI